jgi:hypothetical protein
MKKSNVAVTLSMLAVFASGAIVGALGHRLYMVRTVAAGVAENGRGRETPEQWRRRYMSELTDRLKLDQPQVVQVNTILDETRDQYRAVKERAKPEMESIHRHQVERISALLSPQQKVEYDNFREERERARKEMEKKRAATH